VSNDVAHVSCLKPIALLVWLAASSCCKRYTLTSYGLWMKSVYRRTTIQLAARSGLCTSRYQEVTHRSKLLRTRLTFSRSVMVSVAVSTMGMTELIFFELTLGWRWTASITAISCCLSRCFQQSSVSQNVVYSQNTLLTAKFVIILCSVISQGKIVVLDRWGGKWNHLLMMPRLTTDCAKSYCNRTLIVKVIIENVVTCFYGIQCSVGVHTTVCHNTCNCIKFLMVYFWQIFVNSAKTWFGGKLFPSETVVFCQIPVKCIYSDLKSY